MKTITITQLFLSVLLTLNFCTTHADNVLTPNLFEKLESVEQNHAQDAAVVTLLLADGTQKIIPMHIALHMKTIADMLNPDIMRKYNLQSIPILTDTVSAQAVSTLCDYLALCA